MDQERWLRLQSLFTEAREVSDQDERRTFLAAECGDDAALLGEVLALLEADQRDDSMLDRGLAEVADRLVGESSGALPTRDFGPYRVLDVIGEGGMGVVYLAERGDLGSRAAIKILRDASLSPARRERFASEQRTLAQLTHPSIAQLYDADTLPDGTPWFALEYVEGVPLTEYCRQRHTSLEGRLLLLRAVGEAVQHAHRHLVIHRDLKPSNILVRNDGTVKLLDFGIAKHLESLDEPVDQTRTGLRLMTPAYAAPEQLRGGRVGIHTDIYSLGVILYELLSGRPPFDLAHKTPGEAERIIAEVEPAKPSSAAQRPGASGASWADLDVLCLTAMHKDPQRRYRTVDALIRDIDHYLAGEPLEARPDTWGYRAGKFVRRNRHAVAAAAAALAVLVALVGFYTVRLAHARNVAVAEALRTQRVQRFTLDLFRGGDAAVGPADSLRVVTLLGRGVQEARTLDGEPALQAELYHTLGGIYQALGELDLADSLLRTALAQRRTLHGEDHPDVAESQVALGSLRADQAEYPEAEALARTGLATLRRLLPATHPAIAGAAGTLGEVLEEQGEYDEAIAVLEDAVRLHEAGRAAQAPSPDYLASLTELGNTHFYAGNFGVADSIFRRALALDQEHYGPRHPLVANDLINVGAVQHERGQYAEAERYYREALAITLGFYGHDHPKTAENLTMLSRALIFQEKLEAAAPILDQALAIQERVYGENHPLVASTVNEVGTVALLSGRHEEAADAYRRMARIYRTVYPDGHYLTGIAISNLASVELTLGNNVDAERGFRQAIDLFSTIQSPTHINTGIARTKLGRALLRQGRPRESIGESEAGYDILIGQTDPKVSWLQNARRDIVAAAEALGTPARAARYRAELADTTGG